MIFTICLINNFNNGLYLRECIDSVLNQTTPFDQIIVVDDGSTDHSNVILNSLKNSLDNFIYLAKDNGGQVSTLNFSEYLIAENSQVFLLDADDVYPVDYLENVLKAVAFKPWDFAFCEHHIFDGNSTFPLKSSKFSNESSVFFKSTSAITRTRQCWIGNLTSTLSVSGEVFRKIFPCPYEKNDTLYADDILIFVTSLLGYSKIYLPSISINWRSHDANNSKRDYTDMQIRDRKRAITMLFDFYCNKYQIDRYPSFAQLTVELRLLSSEWKKKLGFPNKFKIFNRLLRQKIFY